MSKTTNRVNEIVNQYLITLSQKGIPILTAYMFGSQAKGNAGPNSDIDLIIVSTAFRGMPLWKRWEVLGDVLAEVLEPIEVRGYAPEELDQAQEQKGSFLHEILNETETIEYRI
jgi:hypothetical protein